MTTALPDSSLPWHRLSQPEYIAMKNAWLDYWRPVLPTPSQRGVLTEIVRWQNYRTGGSFRGHKRIAEDLGCTPKTVQRAVNDLEGVGLLTVNRLRDAPRTAQGLLSSPRRGGRANHYSVDYNAVRNYDDTAGEGEWRVGSSRSTGELSKALRRAVTSSVAQPDPLQVPTVSAECPPNVFNAFNGPNGTNTTTADGGGRAKKSSSSPLQPRLVVTSETTLAELKTVYPDWDSRESVEDWCLLMASGFAVRAANCWPGSVRAKVEILAPLLRDAVCSYDRSIVGSAFDDWFEARTADTSLHNPGAIFFTELDGYLAQATVDAAQDERGDDDDSDDGDDSDGSYESDEGDDEEGAQDRGFGSAQAAIRPEPLADDVETVEAAERLSMLFAELETAHLAGRSNSERCKVTALAEGLVAARGRLWISVPAAEAYVRVF